MVQLGQQLQVAGAGAITFIWFQQLFASINKVFILRGRLGTTL